jgi:hypothetical protein
VNASLASSRTARYELSGYNFGKHHDMGSFQPELQSLDQAKRMLDAFASVGATHFDVTFLDIDGAKRGFRLRQSTWQVKHSLPKLLPGLRERQNSLVVRPHSETSTIIQLDDLKADTLAPLRDVSFLTLQTSPGNYQAWVAVSGLDSPKDFARRLRNGAHADLTASGATRVAGTLNFKRKYERDFPAVAIVQESRGRIVTPRQLEALGLVAAEDAAPAAPFRVSRARAAFPDYQRCLQGAPLNHGQTGPDMSRADFFWSLLAAQRGWDTESIAARLMEVSPKAKENGEEYARITAENATQAVSRQPAGRAR